MPITFSSKPEHDLIIFTHKGEVSDDDFLEFYRRFFQDNAFDSSLKVLTDLREADSSPRSTDTLRQFAGFIGEHLDDSKIPPKVAVVAPKSLSFGLARMYQSYAASIPWEFVVFRAVDAAFAWLDVPENLLDCDQKEKNQEHHPNR